MAEIANETMEGFKMTGLGLMLEDGKIVGLGYILEVD